MKYIPYIKWMIAILGLFFAINMSFIIQKEYIDNDLNRFVIANGYEPSPLERESMRKESLKEAGIDILILVAGVMASCLWLSFPSKNMNDH